MDTRTECLNLIKRMKTTTEPVKKQAFKLTFVDSDYIRIVEMNATLDQMRTFFVGCRMDIFNSISDPIYATCNNVEVHDV